jgi:hypothetical protein
VAERWWKKRRAAALTLAAGVIIVFPIHLGLWFADDPPAPAGSDFLHVAHLLRDRGRGERVLAPWSYGHMFDVIGGQRVVVDNFGSAADPDLFRRAGAILQRAEARELTRFCDRYAVRYVVLEREPDSIAGFRRTVVGRAVLLERISARRGTPPPPSR